MLNTQTKIFVPNLQDWHQYQNFGLNALASVYFRVHM